MSWLWRKTDDAEADEESIEEGKDMLDEIVEDPSPVMKIDRPGNGENSNNVETPQGGNKEEIDDEQSNDDAIYCDDGDNDDDDGDGSSDESSLENTSDDDDDDDDDEDSLVENLIESMTTEEETSDNDVSIIEEGNDDVIDVLDSDDNDSDDDVEDDSTSAKVTDLNENDTDEKRSNMLEQNGPDGLNEEQKSADNDDNDDPVTSFWEKQSLLVLAAEHDRVDILKALLKDENEEKETLLNSGIPPLHLAISFGSVNTAQSLLRMGADPSVRPNIDLVLEERKNQPDDSKVDIPNIRRFEMITAWELAFGNKLYEEKSSSTNKSTTWSLFGSTTPAESDGTSTVATTKTITGDQIIKPLDMAPSKREGIRHAFTAEALRSVGSDEVERLKQLVSSGMPANIDIGGKDLYGWSVEMGALHCEEFLRPIEAAKHVKNGNDNAEHVSDLESTSVENSSTRRRGDTQERSRKHPEENKAMSSFVVHRPNAEETLPQLKNRLDELDSLSTALSICLDNLAEEVSVCHGLLLMGGGASALASHVKSLRDLKVQKFDEMKDIQLECLDAERELTDLVHSTGDIGKEIADIASIDILLFQSKNNNEIKNVGSNENDDSNVDNEDEKQEIKVEQLNLKAQIAASENKIRKLRASIADLSEENIRNLKEVENRGLEGGINLVRGLREELRDLEYNLLEARRIKTACKAKTNMILARVPNQENKNQNAIDYSDEAQAVAKPELGNHNQAETTITTLSDEVEGEGGSLVTSQDVDEDGINEAVVVNPVENNSSQINEISTRNDSKPSTPMPTPFPRDGNVEEFKTVDNPENRNKISPSTRIATGDSQAIAIIQPGNQGFFTVDLWEVLLRIIGYERAANRRSVQNATKSISTSRPNVMII